VQPKLLKFYCIIPIVLQKNSLSIKNAENLDAKELLEVPYNKYGVSLLLLKAK